MMYNTSEKLEQTKPEQTKPVEETQSDEQETESLSEEELKQVNGGMIRVPMNGFFKINAPTDAT